MLRRVVSEHCRMWDRHVPFLLCAYRELPNETTGTPPFEMMFEREATGLLAFLSENLDRRVDDSL